MTVYFCLRCEDQSPWKAGEIVKCPTCKKADEVKSAQRFGNLEAGSR